MRTTAVGWSGRSTTLNRSPWVDPAERAPLWQASNRGGSYDTNMKDIRDIELGLAVSTSPRATNGATVIPVLPWCWLVEIAFYLREMTS